MLRSGKNGKASVGQISGVVVMAGLSFGWSGIAFAEKAGHLQLAPIQFASTVGGNLGYTFQSFSSGSSTARQQMLNMNVNVGLRARSYIWQPWFARIRAGLGVGVGTAFVNTSSSTTRSGNTTLTGETALNILQYSRFPFEARIYRTENQTNGYLSGINSNYLTQGVALTQNYRSLHGAFDGITSYTHSTSGRAGFGAENITDQLSLTMAIQPLHSYQTFRVTGGITKMDYPLTGNNSLTDILIVNHLYHPDSAISVASLLNLFKSRLINKPASSPQQQSDYSSQQLSSFASWRPEGSPLTLNSSARLLRSASRSTTGSGSQWDDTNLNLGANYAWSRLLRMYGSVNINDQSGLQTISTSAALSAQKGFGGSPDAINVGGFRYSRYIGASLSNQTVTTNKANSTQTTTTSTQQLGGNIGHDLIKSTTLGSGGLTIDLNQRLSTILSTRNSPFTNLQSNGSLRWNHAKGRENTMLSLRATDARTLSGRQNFFQLINFQASRNERLALHQSLVGNLTLQVSRSGDRNVSTPFIAVPSADLTYRHERLFHVKNLNFESALRIQGADIVLSHNPANSPNMTTQDYTTLSWDNNLDYFIGRLKMRLYTRIAEIHNVIQSSIFFNISRSF